MWYQGDGHGSADFAGMVDYASTANSAARSRSISAKDLPVAAWIAATLAVAASRRTITSQYLGSSSMPYKDQAFEALREPAAPISEEASLITGITADMVAGKAINADAVAAAVDPRLQRG